MTTLSSRQYSGHCKEHLENGCEERNADSGLQAQLEAAAQDRAAVDGDKRSVACAPLGVKEVILPYIAKVKTTHNNSNNNRNVTVITSYVSLG